MKTNQPSHPKGFSEIWVIAGFIFGAIMLILLCMWLVPKWNIYQQTMAGQAKLREAEWSKKIAIEEARATEESAIMKAQARVTMAEAEGKAELIRAKATAEANQIIGASLRENEAYLRYLWIMGLQDGNGERIYIPTEAGLPILEAGKAK